MPLALQLLTDKVHIYESIYSFACCAINIFPGMLCEIYIFLACSVKSIYSIACCAKSILFPFMLFEIYTYIPLHVVRNLLKTDAQSQPSPHQQMKTATQSKQHLPCPLRYSYSMRETMPLRWSCSKVYTLKGQCHKIFWHFFIS